MAKTRKVLECTDYGDHYKIIFDGTKKTNPYRIYRVYSVFTDYGVRKSVKLQDSFANLVSCFYWFIEHGVGYQDYFPNKG